MCKKNLNCDEEAKEKERELAIEGVEGKRGGRREADEGEREEWE